MISKPKGTYDLYGSNAKKEQELTNIIHNFMEKYNYKYIRTPMFESSELFHRSVGETSDIVSKETYDFIDRGERNLTLRPEGTASVARAFIENKIYADSMPYKAWYYGSMFRYERPQAGRFREFQQFGVEVYGSTDPCLDAEVISIPINLFKYLGFKGAKVNINSLGDTESRKNYKEALVKYLEPHINELCEDCQERFKKNPLRILDCKIDKTNDILKNAPKTIDYLNEESKTYFNKVLEYLDILEVDYEVNPKIVRGLDYYSHVIFEFEANIEGFGNQNTFGGGGRYDGLIELLDGPATPGVGFALGIERIINALNNESIDLIDNDGIDCYVIPVSENEKKYVTEIVSILRENGIITDTDYVNRSFKSNLNYADKLKTKFIIIIGETEQKEKRLTIKDKITTEEIKVKEVDLLDFFNLNL